MKLHMTYVEWIALYHLEKRFKEVDLEKAKHGWISVADDHLKGYLRIVDKYAVYLSLAKEDDFIREIEESLTQPLPEIEELEDAYRETSRFASSDIRLVFYADDRISTPYGELSWFAGQNTVNRILKPLNLVLVEDYDGMTRIEVKVRRPYNRAKLGKAFQLITEGLHLYSAITKAQESRALEITMAMLPLIREKIASFNNAPASL